MWHLSALFYKLKKDLLFLLSVKLISCHHGGVKHTLSVKGEAEEQAECERFPKQWLREQELIKSNLRYKNLMLYGNIMK